MISGCPDKVPLPAEMPAWLLRKHSNCVQMHLVVPSTIVLGNNSPCNVLGISRGSNTAWERLLHDEWKLTVWQYVSDGSVAVAALFSISVPPRFTIREKCRRARDSRELDIRRSIRGICIALPGDGVVRVVADPVDVQL